MTDLWGASLLPIWLSSFSIPFLTNYLYEISSAWKTWLYPDWHRKTAFLVMSYKNQPWHWQERHLSECYWRDQRIWGDQRPVPWDQREGAVLKALWVCCWGEALVLVIPYVPPTLDAESYHSNCLCHYLSTESNLGIPCFFMTLLSGIGVSDWQRQGSVSTPGYSCVWHFQFFSWEMYSLEVAEFPKYRRGIRMLSGHSVWADLETRTQVYVGVGGITGVEVREVR